MPVSHGKLSELKASLCAQPIDLFVGSASFEERSLSVSKHIDISSIMTAIIAENLTYRDVVEPNFCILEDLFREKLIPLHVFADDPVASSNNIAEVLGELVARNPKRIVVDITAFTRESLLMLLPCLRKLFTAADSIVFVYTHAKDYSVGDPPERKWLSKGIRDIRSVLGFPGEMVPSRQTHMIVMVGFEDERALELIRECEPSFVSLGLGDPSEQGTLPHQATNVDRFARLRSILHDVDEFAFKAYDPEATKVALASQIEKHPGCNVVIAPMNTKISTIGAMLLAMENEAVQLCYAPPNIYNVQRYSLPDDEYYLFELSGFPR